MLLYFIINNIRVRVINPYAEQHTTLVFVHPFSKTYTYTYTLDFIFDRQTYFFPESHEQNHQWPATQEIGSLF